MNEHELNKSSQGKNDQSLHNNNEYTIEDRPTMYKYLQDIPMTIYNANTQQNNPLNNTKPDQNEQNISNNIPADGRNNLVPAPPRTLEGSFHPNDPQIPVTDNTHLENESYYNGPYYRTQGYYGEPTSAYYYGNQDYGYPYENYPYYGNQDYDQYYEPGNQYYGGGNTRYDYNEQYFQSQNRNMNMNMNRGRGGGVHNNNNNNIDGWGYSVENNNNNNLGVGGGGGRGRGQNYNYNQNANEDPSNALGGSVVGQGGSRESPYY